MVVVILASDNLDFMSSCVYEAQVRDNLGLILLCKNKLTVGYKLTEAYHVRSTIKHQHFGLSLAKNSS